MLIVNNSQCLKKQEGAWNVDKMGIKVGICFRGEIEDKYDEREVNVVALCVLMFITESEC